MTKKAIPLNAKEIAIRETASLKWRNEIVNAKYTMTLTEFKMLVALACQTPADYTGKEYFSISAKELGVFMELDEKSRYKQIKNAATKLFDRKISLVAEDDENEPSWRLLSWFSEMAYDSKKCKLIFQFTPAVQPLIYQVKEAYVKLQAKPLMAFTSIYASRFMMLFTEWEKLKTKIITVAELKEAFEVGKKYPLFGNFNQKVVQPAIEEINQKTELKIKAEPIKTGRSYTHYKFTITRKKAAKTIDIKFADEQQQAVYDKLVGYGLSSKFVSTYIKSRSLEDVIANLEYAEKYKDTAANFPAYLRNCLENDYGKNGLFTEQKEAEAAAAKLAEMTEEEKARAIAFADFIRQQQAVAAVAAEQAAQSCPADKAKVQEGLEKLKEKLQKRGTEDATL